MAEIDFTRAASSKAIPFLGEQLKRLLRPLARALSPAPLATGPKPAICRGARSAFRPF